MTIRRLAKTRLPGIYYDTAYGRSTGMRLLKDTLPHLTFEFGVQRASTNFALPFVNGNLNNLLGGGDEQILIELWGLAPTR